MNRKHAIVGLFALAAFAASALLLPNTGVAQMDKVKASMETLKAKTAKLGAPKVEGTDPVGGKSAPGLYFGTTKMNNFFDVVDDVVKENGGTATLFVKAGDEYVRVATNVKKDDGTRAIGTILGTIFRYFAYRFWVFTEELDEDPNFADTAALEIALITGAAPAGGAGGTGDWAASEIGRAHV